jgi:hypothetical protein
MVQIRTAAEQLAAEGRQRSAAAETVNGLIAELEQGLDDLTRLAAEDSSDGLGGDGADAERAGRR